MKQQQLERIVYRLANSVGGVQVREGEYVVLRFWADTSEPSDLVLGSLGFESVSVTKEKNGFTHLFRIKLEES